MNEERFWDIISDTKGDPGAVAAILKGLPLAEVDEWHRIYWQKHNGLHRWDVWCAAYVIAGGCSDDGFHYFKAFAVGKGREFYEALAADPDSVGPLLTKEDEERDYENERLNYVIYRAYEALAPGVEPVDLSAEDTDPEGEPFDEDAVAEMMPKLWAQFGDA